RDRKGGRRGLCHAAWYGPGRAVDGGDVARDGRGRPARARRSRVLALGRSARPLDDGDAAERRQPDRRLHVAREWSRACGDRCQGHAACGRDQHRLLDPHRFHRDRHFPVPHPRALRHGRLAGARPIPRRARMMGLFEPVTAVLAIPALAAALLAMLPGYRLTATLNVISTFLTFLAAVALFFGRPRPTPYLLVDDLNNVFIVLTTFVGFTTSVFSASYIGHELET